MIIAIKRKQKYFKSKKTTEDYNNQILNILTFGQDKMT
jgi:hypothetical protein